MLNLSTSQIENKIHSYIKTIGGEQYLTGNIIDFLKYLEDDGQARMNFLTKKRATKLFDEYIGHLVNDESWWHLSTTRRQGLKLKDWVQNLHS